MVIPKIIHIAWKSYDLLESNSLFIKNCIGNLVKLSNWKYVIHNDNDIDIYLKEHLDTIDYKLLSSKHIVEKSDVWRLIKLYQEGGLYSDIDRLCNLSLNSLINDTTKVVIPTCNNLDFSHDFMMSAPGNPIYLETLKLNLQRRYEGCNNTYFLGAQTYLHGIMKCLFGKIIDQTEKNIEGIRNDFEKTNFIQTYKEIPPYNTFTCRLTTSLLNHEEEKRKFYAQSNLRHWTNEW